MIGTGPPASTYGGDIDALISFIWWIVFVWFVAAEGLLIYFVIRYRRRKGERGSLDTWQHIAGQCLDTHSIPGRSRIRFVDRGAERQSLA